MALGRTSLKSARTRIHRIEKTFEFVGYAILVSYFLYLSVVWITARPSLWITDVEIEGAHAVSADSIADIAKEQLNGILLYHIRTDNEFLYPKEEVIEEVMSLSPRIAHVSVDFTGRHTLRVAVTEFTPNFLFCMASDLALASSTSIDRQPKDCYFADEKGYVYSEAPEYLGYPFVAIIASTSEEAVTHATPVGTHALSEEEYARIRSFIDDLSRAGLSTHSVTLMPDHDVEIEVGMPWKLLWTTTRDPEASFRNLGVVLDSLAASPSKGKDVTQIDLRFGNKIFYR
jgi:hypothetical protein